MAALLTGCVFGIALVIGGFQNPVIIKSGSTSQEPAALTFFFTAVASSTVVYHMAERFSLIALQPRSSSPLGLFGSHGANILGGSLLGLGIALVGAGPETLVAQVAAGVPSGIFAFVGALVGGILWTGPIRSAMRSWNAKVGVANAEMIPLHERLGLPKLSAVLLVELASAGAIYRTLPREISKTDILSLDGVRGGLLVGVAQLISLLTRRSMMGISGSYEEFGNMFWWLCSGEPRYLKPSSYQNVLFWLGALAGSLGILWTYPEKVSTLSDASIAPFHAASGGCLMAVGSRLAGGCTCGHGISGMSLLSTASLVTMASTFGSAAAMGHFLSGK